MAYDDASKLFRTGIRKKKKSLGATGFFDEINNVTPWAALVAQIEPFYPKGTGQGRPPIGVARMLRMYTPTMLWPLRTKAPRRHL